LFFGDWGLVGALLEEDGWWWWEDGTVLSWSGLGWLELDWAVAIDGIVPVVALRKSPALFELVAVVMLITWVPVIGTGVTLDLLGELFRTFRLSRSIFLGDSSRKSN